MVNKKYELVPVDGERAPYRVRALRDFKDVKAGDLGGYVDSEYNLSHDGNCWLYDSAASLDRARLQDDSYADGLAMICDSSTLIHNAAAHDNAVVSGLSLMRDNSVICDEAIIRNTQLQESAAVQGGAHVYGTWMDGYSVADGYARVSNAAMHGHSKVAGASVIEPGVVLGGDVEFTGESKVSGKTKLDMQSSNGRPIVYHNAEIVDGQAVSAVEKRMRKHPQLRALVNNTEEKAVDSKTNQRDDAGLEM